MAKKFIDSGVDTKKDDMSIADGTALTLTNSVRVLYDDTVPSGDLVVALRKVIEKINENEA